jgi:hypothetical protein
MAQQAWRTVDRIRGARRALRRSQLSRTCDEGSPPWRSNRRQTLALEHLDAFRRRCGEALGESNELGHQLASRFRPDNGSEVPDPNAEVLEKVALSSNRFSSRHGGR